MSRTALFFGRMPKDLTRTSKLLREIVNPSQYFRVEPKWLIFYMPHMEYDESIGLVSKKKMIFFLL
jgi:hypothetical protein